MCPLVPHAVLLHHQGKASSSAVAGEQKLTDSVIAVQRCVIVVMDGVLCRC